MGQYALFPEKGGIILVLEENAFNAGKGRTVEDNAQLVQHFLGQAVSLKGIAQPGNGGIDVGHFGQLCREAPVDDRLDGGGKKIVDMVPMEKGLQIVKGRQILHRIDALAIQPVVLNFYIQFLDAFFVLLIPWRNKAYHAVSLCTHFQHEDTPEKEGSAGLIAQYTNSHT